MKKLRGILFLVALVCLVLGFVGWHESASESKTYTVRQAADALVQYVDGKWSTKHLNIHVSSAKCAVLNGNTVTPDKTGTSFVCNLGVSDGECIGATFTYDGTQVDVKTASALSSRYCS